MLFDLLKKVVPMSVQNAFWKTGRFAVKHRKVGIPLIFVVFATVVGVGECARRHHETPAQPVPAAQAVHE